ncbi:MAG: hypothetical protein BYD32DRAFT_462093 [Podila humilis]|nr:MAG: hypothetical protein BYD32DRAFT_462093 [Podila humilis]
MTSYSCPTALIFPSSKVGQNPDARSAETCRKKGVPMKHRARQDDSIIKDPYYGLQGEFERYLPSAHDAPMPSSSLGFK